MDSAFERGVEGWMGGGEGGKSMWVVRRGRE